MTEIELIASIVVAVQVLGTAWLHKQANKNACGGKKCVEQFVRAISQVKSTEIGGQIK